MARSSFSDAVSETLLRRSDCGAGSDAGRPRPGREGSARNAAELASGAVDLEVGVAKVLIPSGLGLPLQAHAAELGPECLDLRRP